MKQANQFQRIRDWLESVLQKNHLFVKLTKFYVEQKRIVGILNRQFIKRKREKEKIEYYH
jgi:hypothetical protein